MFLFHWQFTIINSSESNVIIRNKYNKVFTYTVKCLWFNRCFWVWLGELWPRGAALRFSAVLQPVSFTLYIYIIYIYVFISILHALRARSAFITNAAHTRLIHSSIVTSHTSTLFDPLRSDWPHEVISELFTAEMIHGFTRQSSRHSESGGYNHELNKH